MYPDRKTAARLGQHTLQVLEDGAYVAPSGARVDIAASVASARERTRSLRFDAALPPLPEASARSTRFEVSGETTLEASLRLYREHGEVLALNFASARHPGGGFARGARAQEESLARSSGLFACIDGDPMYAHHESLRDPMYSDWAIVSPDVPVFRDDAGTLLEQPWPCTFLTCAAVNAKVVLERDASRGNEIRERMQRRVGRVLAIARAFSCRRLVLGAWGCGVFGNEPRVLAELFDDGLRAHAGAFEHVAFAILDSSPEQRFRGPFEERFGGR